MRYRLGVDLGGTKIELAALAADGSIAWRQRAATPQGDYAATLRVIASLVEAAERALGRDCSVGVGMPGALSALDGRVKNANSTCLNGRALKQDLEALLGREVRLANDANCFALSEAVDGAGAGAEVVFGVILGTGVGGGIVVRGRWLQGANAIAGEWGHNPLAPAHAHEWPGPACYCGRHGCVETWLSGPGLAADHARAGHARLSAAEIVRAAEAGNADCEASLQRYEVRLARALAQVVNLIDPDVIVLGGGLSKIGRLYRNVPHLWREHVFSDHVATRLLPNVHGDSSGVRGAAWLFDAPTQ